MFQLGIRLLVAVLQLSVDFSLCEIRRVAAFYFKYTRGILWREHY